MQNQALRTSAVSTSTEPNMTTPELWEQACPLFANLDPAEMSILRDRFDSETFAKGEVILREGNTFQVLWVIKSGDCEVFKMVKPDVEQRLTTLDAGSVFGEMSFFESAPHSASIRTLGDVEVAKLSRDEFLELEKSHPNVVTKLLANSVRILANRLRGMDEWICELVERPGGTENQRQEWREFRSKLYTDWHF